MVRRSNWRHGCLVWIGRGLLALPLLILTALAFGAAASAFDVQQHPPPGRMVDIAGYRLHVNCLGEGRPTVILDSGAGGSSLDWALIQPDLARTTRTCAYDRAGAAWSDPGPPPRTAGQMSQELHAVLVSDGMQGPYVFVSASFAGHIARLYASAYPADVAGMVLVDARPEDWDSRFPEIRQAGEEQLGSIRLFAWLSRLGITRLLLPIAGPPAFVEKYPAELRSTVTAVTFQAKSYDAIVDLAAGVQASDSQVRAAKLPDRIPVAVITHGKADNDLFAGLPENRWPEAEAAWQELQRDLSRRLNGRLVVAGSSGHAIALDQPAIVISTVIEVFRDARR